VALWVLAGVLAAPAVVGNRPVRMRLSSPRTLGANAPNHPLSDVIVVLPAVDDAHWRELAHSRLHDVQCRGGAMSGNSALERRGGVIRRSALAVSARAPVAQLDTILLII
jgi:hypothetical protein